MAIAPAPIAVNRLSLGARPGELKAAAQDPKAWALDHLKTSPFQTQALKALPQSAPVLAKYFTNLQAARKSKDPEQMVRQTARKSLLHQGSIRLVQAVETPHGFHERLVQFWSNHFAISADKPTIVSIPGLYEKEAIRPHVTGRFVDMLLAVEKHPAMLLYLDNQRSMGDNSKAAKFLKKRRGQDAGLNENLAREILELHTLGVDGGYDQQDIIELAKAITGWGIGGQGRGRLARKGTPGAFVFREELHEPGARRLLGKRYSDGGVSQGEAILKDLARHPSTARFISQKLARHFIGDEINEGIITRLAQTYLNHDGALMPVYKALLDEKALWDQPYTKFKTPWEHVASTFRLFGTAPDKPQMVLGALRRFGHFPWLPGSPAGFPDDAAHWSSADAIMKRIEWAIAVGEKAGPKVNSLNLANVALGSSLSPKTAKAILGAESQAQGLSLLLASPEFMRR